MTPIEFWFDFASPYAYFGALQLDDIADRHDRDVVWRPFLLGPAFAATGMQPLTHMPIRGDYARRDWARLARGLSVPFHLPDKHPFATLAASRAFYVIEPGNAETAVRFARHVFALTFGEGRDTSDRALVLDIAAGVGVDRTALDAALDTADVKQVLRDRTDEAIARGIFGSPFFIVDGEPFWGADRLPMIDEWLTRGGW
ncbi:2-hydroxychromene-2-carboxylate isomerase [Xanthobacteraceae bacterium Astr-EGSB]|uniref:2-hydroxychromene-2-carboxylate isomerase n=1 Tax=Astrobacterium formosum TaxID=3069710 RepID=UPI0027B2127D|nr:2-hydroxychromene-2-carboxylate isomerase [Xanthobacteraceae bacterium Astr-EGSB]